jgi:hypothetical protein
MSEFPPDVQAWFDQHPGTHVVTDATMTSTPVMPTPEPTPESSVTDEQVGDLIDRVMGKQNRSTIEFARDWLIQFGIF